MADTYLLRKVRRNRWNASGLEPGEVKADALKDLSTDENELSVFNVGEDCCDFISVVAALASQSENLNPFDYALIRKDEALRAFKTKQTDGDTPHKNVNENMHLDLAHLTVHDIKKLAELIQSGSEAEVHTELNLTGVGRIQGKKVQQWIRQELDQDRMDFSLVRINNKVELFKDNSDVQAQG